MSRGILKYSSRHIRGNMYCIVLLLLAAIVLAPHSPVTTKATTSFLDSRIWEGNSKFDPLREQRNRAHVVNMLAIFYAGKNSHKLLTICMFWCRPSKILDSLRHILKLLSLWSSIHTAIASWGLFGNWWLGVTRIVGADKKRWEIKY